MAFWSCSMAPGSTCQVPSSAWPMQRRGPSSGAEHGGRGAARGLPAHAHAEDRVDAALAVEDVERREREPGVAVDLGEPGGRPRPPARAPRTRRRRRTGRGPARGRRWPTTASRAASPSHARAKASQPRSAAVARHTASGSSPRRQRGDRRQRERRRAGLLHRVGEVAASTRRRGPARGRGAARRRAGRPSPRRSRGSCPRAAAARPPSDAARASASATVIESFTTARPVQPIGTSSGTPAASASRCGDGPRADVLGRDRATRSARSPRWSRSQVVSAGVGLALGPAAEGDVVEGEHHEPRADRHDLVDLGGEGGSVVGRRRSRSRGRARWRSRAPSAPSAAKRSKPASSSAS